MADTLDCDGAGASWKLRTIDELAIFELRRDALFRSLSAAQRRLYVEGAVAIGLEQGRRYQGKPVQSLVEELGARYVVSNAAGVIAGSRIFAEYDLGSRVITVYATAIDTIARLLANSTPSAGDARRIALDLLLAHELFHHLEATRILPAPLQLSPVTVPVFRGLLRRRRHVRSASEIAAHAFAETLTGVTLTTSLRNNSCLRFDDASSSLEA